MRKLSLSALVALFPAFLLVFLVGCPATPPTPPAADKKTTDKSGEAPKGKEEEIKTATTGVIKGTVKFKGTAPEMKMVIDLKHADSKTCMMAPDNQKNDQKWIVDDKGGVANVVISLAPPTGKKFAEFSDELKKPFKEPAVMDQPYCAYVPHVVALYAGVQPLIVKNSASVSHNVKIEAAGAKNPAFDKVIPKGSDSGPLTYSKWAKPISVECSMHTWMKAKILVFDNPYFAVTKSDGSFTIANVPIDSELIVYMWHESQSDKIEAKKMTFKAGDNPLELEIK